MEVEPLVAGTSAIEESAPKSVIEFPDHSVIDIPSAVEPRILPNAQLSVGDLISGWAEGICQECKGCKIELDSEPPKAVGDALLAEMASRIPRIHADVRKMIEKFSPTVHPKFKAFTNGSVAVLHGSERTSQFPLWALTYWDSRHNILTQVIEWKTARTQLEANGDITRLDILAGMPWNGKVHREIGCRAFTLARFLTQEWLANDHLNVIGQMILRHAPAKHHFFNIETGQALVLGYRRRGSLPTTDTQKKAAQLLLENRQVAFCFNVNVVAKVATLARDGTTGSHWMAVIIDRDSQTITHADSMVARYPTEAQKMFDWWFDALKLPRMTVKSNEDVVSQQNGFVCGDMASLYIGHQWCPEIYERYPADADGQAARRLRLFDQIYTWIKEMVCDVVDISMTS